MYLLLCVCVCVRDVCCVRLYTWAVRRVLVLSHRWKLPIRLVRWKWPVRLVTFQHIYYSYQLYGTTTDEDSSELKHLLFSNETSMFFFLSPNYRYSLFKSIILRFHLTMVLFFF